MATKNLADKALVRVKAKKKVAENSLLALQRKYDELKAKISRVRGASQQNFEHCKQWCDHSSQ